MSKEISTGYSTLEEEQNLAKEITNCKYPDGKEKQPGTEHDDPGDAKEDRYLSGIYQGSTLPQRSVYEKV